MLKLFFAFFFHIFYFLQEFQFKKSSKMFLWNLWDEELASKLALKPPRISWNKLCNELEIENIYNYYKCRTKNS